MAPPKDVVFGWRRPDLDGLMIGFEGNIVLQKFIERDRLISVYVDTRVENMISNL